MNNSYIFLWFLSLWVIASCGYGNLDYSYDASPGVSGVSSIVNADGTVTVTLTGTGFVQGCTNVTINGTSCGSVNVIQTSVLTCYLPSSSIPLIDIAVSNSACDGDDATPSPTPVSTSHTVFVSSSTHTGSMGGLSGADSICAGLGATGTKTSGASGTWRAILSASDSIAQNRITFVTGAPIKNTAGTIIADNSTDLWDGNLDAKINFNENGTQVSVSTTVWSGSSSNGTHSGSSCANWTTSSSTLEGQIGGTAYFNTGDWIDNGTSFCNLEWNLYCINSNN